MRRALASLSGLAVLALVASGSALAVSITNYTPTSDFIPVVSNQCVGTSITINGSGFVTDGGTTQVAFGGTPAVDVTIGSDNVIYAKIPGNAPDTGNITVTTGKGTATSATTYSLAPCASQAGPVLLAPAGQPVPGTAVKATVSGFRPAKAKAGATVTITGSGLTEVTSVKFGGVASKFKIVSATKITATVPAKARSGKVTVTTAAGISAGSARFTKL